MLSAIERGNSEVKDVTDLLAAGDSIVLVGERAAAAAGRSATSGAVAETTGARLAWVPRRAGERGALEAGALPNLLPGGRPVADAAARVDLQTAWETTDVPGRARPGHRRHPGRGRVRESSVAWSIGGVDPADLTDPQAALAAIQAAGFVVSLEIRHSDVTQLADVVLPVAAAEEKGGTFLDWEGRARPFAPVLSSSAISDYRAVDLLADQMDVRLGLRDLASVRAELASLGAWDGDRVAAPDEAPGEPLEPHTGQAVLATWRLLLDNGRLQDGEPYLAGTATRPVARLSAATAAEVGVADGAGLVVSTAAGRITLPVVIDELPDFVVWLPTNSQSSTVLREPAGRVRRGRRPRPGRHGPPARAVRSEP